MDTDELIKKVQDKNKFVSLLFSDMLGHIKSVKMPVSQLEKALKDSIGVDGSSLLGFARIEESDQRIIPDPNTYRVLPWTKDSDMQTATFNCNIYNPDGTPFEGCPRNILKRAIDYTENLGFKYNVSGEMEFFLFDADDAGKPKLELVDGILKPIPVDTGGYFDYYSTKAVDRMVLMLEDMGFEVEASHKEVAEGQFEIDFKYSDAMTSADTILLLKLVVKEIARQQGYYASFMPKPIYGVNGSGMHVNQSLSDLQGNNIFYDPGAEHGLSKILHQFTAGQLEHAPSFLAITSPLVNSYKRLTPGYEAPVYLTRGRINRSGLIRIPDATGKSIRAEIRVPDPSSNPYLVFAVLLRAGLDGIESNINPPPFISENVYHMTEQERLDKGIYSIPGSLIEAVDKFSNSDLMKATLGEHLFREYIKAKTQEWDKFRTAVTNWEIKEFLRRY